jgi:hypothetical protein
VVFFMQDVWQGPVAQAVDVTQLTFAVEDFLGPFAGHAKGFGEGAKELDDLGNVVIVFAVLGAGLGVEEVVARYEFEDLDNLSHLQQFQMIADIPLRPYSTRPC